MKTKMKKICDRCGNKGYHRRWALSTQFPDYSYEAFDLCKSCEKEFKIMKIKFMEVNK